MASLRLTITSTPCSFGTFLTRKLQLDEDGLHVCVHSVPQTLILFDQAMRNRLVGQESAWTKVCTAIKDMVRHFNSADLYPGTAVG